MEKVADCIPIKSIDIHYQVRCFDGGQYTVDLQHYTCTCRAWQLSGIPCTHALCAILSKDLDPDDFVHKFYTVDMYKVAYQYPIYGISYDALWVNTGANSVSELGRLSRVMDLELGRSICMFYEKAETRMKSGITQP
ncbi:hypothetical protein ACS0TY_033291 [Phlomoides rotata]